MTSPTIFPMQLILETTAFCTQRCIHCAHKTLKRPKGHMSGVLFNKIIDEVACEAPETEVWMTFYGEALILKDALWSMVRYAKNKGLTNVILNSNAMLLDSKATEGLLESGLDRFIISMDALTKETYESVRVGGRYVSVMANIEFFLKAWRARTGAKPRFEMQFSVLEENAHELEGFKAYWHDQGVYVKVRPKASWAGRVAAPNLNKTAERVPCAWALRHGAILWTGDLVACGVDCEGEFIAGNVSSKTIRQIWNTTHRDFRQIHLDNKWDQLPQVCGRCLDWQTTPRVYLAPTNTK